MVPLTDRGGIEVGSDRGICYGHLRVPGAGRNSRCGSGGGFELRQGEVVRVGPGIHGGSGVMEMCLL